MSQFSERLRAAVWKAVRRPRRTGRVVLSRLFPVRAMVRDPEAYQAVANWTFGRAPRVPLTDLFPGVEDVDVTALRAFDRSPHASLSSTELLALGAIVRLRRPKRILEVGTFEGNTTLNLAANAPGDAQIITLDLPPDSASDLGLAVPEDMRNKTAKSLVGRQLHNGRGDPRIRQVFGDSAIIDWGNLPGPFDLVFIDGCHFETYVRSDTRNAITHLAPDGIIIWHDYGIIEDVARVVDEVSDRLRVSAIRGTSLAVATAR